MIIKVILFISLTALLLASCLTTGERQYFRPYSPDFETESEVIIDSPVELPEISLFVSAPYEEEESPIVEIVISETEIPESLEEIGEVESAKTENDITESQVIVAAPVQIQTIQEPVQKAIAEPQSEPEIIVSPEPEIISSAAQAVSTEANEVAGTIDEVLESIPGEELIITLEKEGWIYDSYNSSVEVELRAREFSNGNTKFLFLPKESGDFYLLFLLQNSESGNEERISYTLKALEKDSDSGLPVVIDPSAVEMEFYNDETADPALFDAVEEENVPDIVASIDQLISPESNPGSEILLNVFDLLENQGGYDDYLVELAENSFRLYPYDHYSAEMLYRAAQGLEKPGDGQDIEKAVSLFKLVRDYFPLSIFSDRSEERIRYLERHFMKIY